MKRILSKIRSNNSEKPRSMSIRVKLMLVYSISSLIVFSINLLLYSQVNRTIERIDQLYVSNVSLNELSDSLDAVHDSLYEYLTTKSSDALDTYYRSEGKYTELYSQLTDTVTNNEMLLLERNIRFMSEDYLAITDDAIQDKRGQNVEKYKQRFEDAEDVFGHIQDYIYTLNNMQFQINSDNYSVLLTSLQYLEFSSSIVLLILTAVNIFVILLWTGNVIRPLVRLAQTANAVAAGDINAEVTGPRPNDEIGVVTNAFDEMLKSIRLYIRQTTESMENERALKEKELLMETHLKDTQLRYLQAQINPHFLFNSLNAGAQLAMMEGAEKTCLFIEKMADFFRYNVRKDNEIMTIENEVMVVENYLYITNVRFDDGILFRKKVDKTLLRVKIPGMVLQPIVENSVKHGLRESSRRGKITLTVYRDVDRIVISIADNGRGITAEKIAEIMNLAPISSDIMKDSTGIGLSNVISRLRLYYNRDDVFEIKNLGVDKGTEVLIRIPAESEIGKEKPGGGQRV